jgi:hydrogenase maturation protease
VRLLVAGIGNIFLGDDGFGCAVAEQLCERAWPAGVEVVDFGIRGMDLALALTSGIDGAILVDAVARGGAPGTLYTIQPAGRAAGEPGLAAVAIDGHAMDPVRVLALAASLGKLPGVLRVVGCEPLSLDDDGDVSVGLSAPVARAVAPAADLVAGLVRDLLEATCTS